MAEKGKEKGKELYDRSEESEQTYGVEPNTGYCVDKGETRASNRFKGKNIIITGGAGNFGIRCAERFASEGANVALWDLRDASKVAERISKEFSVKCKAYVVNVTKEDVVNGATESVVVCFLFSLFLLAFVFFLCRVCAKRMTERVWAN